MLQESKRAWALLPFRFAFRQSSRYIPWKVSRKAKAPYEWDFLHKDAYQQIITIGQYKEVTGVLDGHTYDKDELQTGELLADAVLREFIYPLPTEEVLKNSVDFTRRPTQYGQSSLDCISFSRVGAIRNDRVRNEAFNQGQIYCLNPSTHVLHATQTENGYAANFNNFVSFAEHIIPREVDLLQAGFQAKTRLRAKLEITSLKSAPDLTVDTIREAVTAGEDVTALMNRNVVPPDL